MISSSRREEGHSNSKQIDVSSCQYFEQQDYSVISKTLVDDLYGQAH